jgi:hypothetical protein
VDAFALDPRVPLGVGPPIGLPVPITSVLFDLTTVTGAAILARAPNGDEFTWAASFVATSPTSGTTTHTFATTDLTETGIWTYYVVLTVPGGTVPCATQRLVVYDPLG